MYEERTYRTLCNSELQKKHIEIEESDLMVYFSHSIDGLTDKLKNVRNIIKQHIGKENLFLTSLVPLKLFSDNPNFFSIISNISFNS